MAEVAGLVLGAIPIAIWALEKYQEPYEAYTSYHNTINTLKANLHIQKMHLDATLQGLGLRDPTPEELRDCLVRRFPERHQDLLFIIGKMDDLTAELMEGLMVDINCKPCWTDEPPERASWEWRRVKRSFSTKKRDKILSDLRNWNDDLKNLIERAEVPAEDGHGSAAVEKVKQRFNRHSCDSLRSKVRALHAAIETGVVDVCNEPSHRASIDLDEDWLGGRQLKNHGSNASPTTFTVHLVHGFEREPAAPWRSFHALHTSMGTTREPNDISSTTSRLSAPSSSMPSSRSPSPSARSKLSLSRMFRKSVSFVPPNVTVETEILPVASTESQNDTPSVRDLCAEIQARKSPERSQAFGHVKSNGDLDKFSLRHVPDSHPKIAHAICLREMLTPPLKGNEDPVQDMDLSPKRRYALAASLAKAVLYLSDSPWLNDPWDNDEVKLFIVEQDPASTRKTLSEHAHISCLFGASTPPPEKAPDAMAQMLRFIPNRLIFALGILLIELAINQAIPKTSLDAILQGDFLTLRRNLDKVHREAGSLYGNAAQRCVYCEFMGHSSQADLGLPAFRQQFHDTVVAPLQATYEVFSTLYSAA